MKPTKIIVIGAASASFGLQCLQDAVTCEGISGSELWLVDIDAENLEISAKLARRMNDESGAGLKISHTTDRLKALPGADFVITSFAVERTDLWKLDWQIPIKHGIQQVLGENGGPGGLSHALRNIPILLDICHDMERLCPKAFLLNFSNPESRLCLAVSKHTSIKAVGLCHGIKMGIDSVKKITGVEDIDVTAAGLNHFTWMLSITNKATGEDVYPLLRKKAVDCAPDYLPLTREMFRAFGLFPSPSDDHIGEYVGWAWDKCAHHGFDFEEEAIWREGYSKRIAAMANGLEPIDAYLSRESGEPAFDVIRGMVENTGQLMPAVNIPNLGCIPNLPDDAVVEVPAYVGTSGLTGLKVGPLPDGIAALCNTQVNVQKLVVEAAVTGSRDIALQAMLADPVVHNMDAGEKCLDELLAVHKPYLPQF